MGFSRQKRSDASLNDGFGCGKIRFAYPQGNDIFHGGGNIKKFTDSRWFESGNLLSQKLFHNPPFYLDVLGIEPGIVANIKLATDSVDNNIMAKQ